MRAISKLQIILAAILTRREPMTQPTILCSGWAAASRDGQNYQL